MWSALLLTARPSTAFCLSQPSARIPSQSLRRSLTTTAASVSTTGNTEEEFDVIVVGGGHAGCEAAAAAARTGAKTALVTQKIHTVGELSCNPSIGGIGKGHLVREIDALGGLMGQVADEGGIHYRMLNQRKGPAVRGPRAQMDRDLYQQAMQDILHNYPNLHLVEASAQDLLLDESSVATLEGSFSSEGTSSLDANIEDGLLGMDAIAAKEQMIQATLAEGSNQRARIRGVLAQNTDGTTREIYSRAVVITTGTFLRGVLMLGHDRYSGGRHLRDSEEVEAPSVGLAKTLERFQFPLGRLKTGTPARVDGRTIDFDCLPIQPSDIPGQPFSHLLQFKGPQPPNLAAGKTISCYQTATNEETHKLVMDYEHTLPIYDGLDGKGNGPRYCPSIYKKVQRFPERAGHNCFLEPEGLNTDLVYPNGMSGPYPPDIQQKILRTMKGMGAVEIVRPGYDVEYDFINPQALTHTLETRKIGGLYLAGQICGTTGYEEAGAQGIIAGANAGRSAAAAARGEKAPLPLILGRDEAYIGVLIDDLVTRGTQEPYRMFTSRAEYRISLRQDNADLRLTRKAAEYDLLHDEERLDALQAREFLIDERISKLRSYTMKVTEWAERGGQELMGGQSMSRKGEKKTAYDVLRMPKVVLKDVEDIMLEVSKEEQLAKGEEISLEDCTTPASVYDSVEASVKYSQYVEKQYKDMESWRKAQGMRIPPDIEYTNEALPSLSNEELEKLQSARPNTLAEASRISGITPEGMIYLYQRIQKRNQLRDQARAAESR